MQKQFSLHAGQVTAEREIPERCSVVELWNVSEDALVSVARCRVLPGVTTQLHSLAIRERYVIEQGSGIMEVDGKEPFRVVAGDAVDIPANNSQRICNAGTGDLIFLAVCTPAFRLEHYRDLEGDVASPPPLLP